MRYRKGDKAKTFLHKNRDSIPKRFYNTLEEKESLQSLSHILFNYFPKVALFLATNFLMVSTLRAVR